MSPADVPTHVLLARRWRGAMPARPRRDPARRPRPAGVRGDPAGRHDRRSSKDLELFRTCRFVACMCFYVCVFGSHPRAFGGEDRGCGRGASMPRVWGGGDSSALRHRGGVWLAFAAEKSRYPAQQRDLLFGEGEARRRGRREMRRRVRSQPRLCRRGGLGCLFCHSQSLVEEADSPRDDLDGEQRATRGQPA